jgi:hypothetical protein
MGDLSFGKSFNMLRDGKDTYFLKQLHADMKMIGLFSHLTWLFPFFKRIPVVNTDYLKMWNWVGNRVRERIEVSYSPDCQNINILIVFYSSVPQIVQTSSPGFWMPLKRDPKQSRIDLIFMETAI